MLGIDITNIKRFEKQNQQFIEKVLHRDEIIEYNNSKEKAVFLAKRWAIKEALFKADNKLFSFSEINIKKEDRTYKYPGYVISTSREGDIIIAIAQKEK